MLCKECDRNPIENRDTGLCASCGALARKLERQASKPVKVYQMPKVSPKMAKELRTYSQKKADHLKKHPYCQIKLIGCTHRGTQVHHAAKRGKNLNNEETFMTACDDCHNYVERVMSAKERRERGFLK